MRIDEGERVVSADGNELGPVRRVVVDPSTFEVTHVVVTGGLLDEDRVVAADHLSERDGEGLVLDEAVEIGDLPLFEERRTVPVDQTDDDMPTSGPLAWYWPYGVTGVYPAFGDTVPRPVETERNVPAGTSALRVGAEVHARDGVRVGNVDEVIVGERNEVESFVVSSGAVFRERTMIPVAWVASIGDEAVQLGVGQDVLEGLPPYTGD